MHTTHLQDLRLSKTAVDNAMAQERSSRSRHSNLAPIRLPAGFSKAPSVLAMGSETTSTLCLLQNGSAILSQPLRSLPTCGVFKAQQQILETYQPLLKQPLRLIAMGHRSRGQLPRLARKLATTLSNSNRRLPIQTIQHHHAHIAACLAENQCPLNGPAVLGIALGEFGYSENGTLWGGEFLLTDYRHCQRIGTFKPVSLLEDSQAIDQPWCNAYTHLIAAFDWEDLQAAYGDLELLQFFSHQPHAVLTQLLLQRIGAPLTSSVSRLFDAVAAAIGLHHEQAIQPGQGAQELEALIQPEHLLQAIGSGYAFEVRYLGRGKSALPYLESRAMWQALLEDLLQKTPPALMAARFHLGLSQAIGQMACHHSFTHVALTGSVFQNAILLQQVSRCLSQIGLTVITHQTVPWHPSRGLSLGQAAIAAARSMP
jgi:hydrogenase maturation protein HypF